MDDTSYLPGRITYYRDGHCPLVRYSEFLTAVSQALHQAIEPLHVQPPDMPLEECERPGIEPLPLSEGGEEWKEQAPSNLYRLNQEARELFVNESPKVNYASFPDHCRDEIGQLIQESREAFNEFLEVSRYMPSDEGERRQFLNAMVRLQVVATKILFFGKPAEPATGSNEDLPGGVDVSGWPSMTKAAREYGISMREIRQWIDEGHVKAYPHKNKICIDRESLRKHYEKEYPDE